MTPKETPSKLLEKTEATLARLEAHLDASTEENAKIKAHVGRLDEALRKTASGWMKATNTQMKKWRK